MPYKVLIVDDSNFFQSRLKEIVAEHPQLEVAGVAANGREGVEMAERLRPDVITMDFEMPVMDGVSAVREIMASWPVPILMFSSLTYEGARVTLDALEAGAVDFIPKNFAEVSRDSAALKRKLHDRLLTIARDARRPVIPSPPTTGFGAKSVGAAVSETSTVPVASLSSFRSGSAVPGTSVPDSSASARHGTAAGSLKNKLSLVAIGASTGGPVALVEVLTALPANFPLPIVLVQHMPENFTKAFAERLNKQCEIEVREAKDGDALKPGLALLAPGGQQMMVDRRGGGCVKVLPGDSRVNYRPSVDITFGSAANSFNDRVLAVILTGMGADGCEGSRLLKAGGSKVWSQDKGSCVVYGMPMAVVRANLSDQVLGLKDIGPRMVREIV